MAAKGIVQLIGTPITSGMGGGTAAAVFANPPDFTTNNYVAAGATNYFGIDLGSGNSAVLTDYSVAGMPTHTGSQEEYSALLILSGSAGANPTTSSTLIDQFPGTCNVTVSLKFTNRSCFNDMTDASGVLGTFAFRSFGFTTLAPSGFGGLAAAQLFANAASIVGTPTFLPVAPTIYPWGGHGVGVRTVTITTRTDSAAVYYTTDGTTPTNASTLYTGPFTVTPTASNITVKAIAYDTNCTTATSNVSTAVFYYYSFKPNDSLIDQNGDLCRNSQVKPIYANGRWWTYAANMQSPNDGTAGQDAVYFPGVHCESSADLQNWIWHGRVLNNGDQTTITASESSNIRDKVQFCKATGLYVMYSKVYPTNVTGVCVAPTPSGPWRRARQFVVGSTGNGAITGMGDCDFFVDPDTQIGYLIFLGLGPQQIFISQLTADYLNDNGAAPILVTGWSNIEGVTLFKRNGVFFCMGGFPDFYDTTTVDVAPVYKSGSTIAAMAAAAASLCFASSQLGTFNNGQLSGVINVNGTYLCWSDYWPNSSPGSRILDLYNARYVVQLITFPTPTTMQIQPTTTLNLSAPFIDGGASSRLRLNRRVQRGGGSGMFH